MDDLTTSLGDAGAGWCPHLAILVPGPAEVIPALASFYGLGARRNGWLFHRSLPGRAAADRAALAEAGLDVQALESGGRLVIAEPPIDTDPDGWALRWVPVMERALAGGFDAAWFSRYPIRLTEENVTSVAAFDRAWDEAFHDQPAVSLCVYIVEDADGGERERRAGALGSIHDGVVLPGAAGAELIRTR
jgi:hypothetical protein